jgi:hypothetical protein
MATLYVLAAFFALLAICLVIRSYVRFRGLRLVNCPETRAPVGVKVNATRAALSSLYRAPKLELSSCSRWPERADCGQECVAQIQTAPNDCLVKNIAAR